MKTFTLFIVALFATLASVSDANAQSLTFDVVATDTVVGGTVNWQILVTSSDFANNFGINTVTANLFDNGGNTLSVGTIGAPFADYSTTFGGFATGSSIGEIGATLTVQNNATVEGQTGNLGPHVLATGSFTANTLGTFNLDTSAGSLNNYFTSAGSLSGTGGIYSGNVFNSGSYTVTAVPEPGSFAMFSVALIGLARRRRS